MDRGVLVICLNKEPAGFAQRESTWLPSAGVISLNPAEITPLTLTQPEGALAKVRSSKAPSLDRFCSVSKLGLVKLIEVVEAIN